MADMVALELVSPENLILSKEIEMAILPAEEGDLGVQPGHAPMISTVKPGTISVFKGTTVEERIFVSGGFLEITEERCTVLAEEAISIADIDVSVVKQQISDLTDDVKIAKSDSERERAEVALSIAVAKLQAVETPAYS